MCHFFFFPSLIWLHHVLVAIHGIFSLHCGIRIFSCSRWDLVLWPGVEPGPPSLTAWSFSHWTNREVPMLLLNLCVHTQSLCLVQFFETPWTVAHQAPLSMGFSRQEYWSGLPCPPPGDLPDPGIEPSSLISPALAGGFFTTSTTWEAPDKLQLKKKNPTCLSEDQRSYN